MQDNKIVIVHQYQIEKIKPLFQPLNRHPPGQQFRQKNSASQYHSNLKLKNHIRYQPFHQYDSYQKKYNRSCCHRQIKDRKNIYFTKHKIKRFYTDMNNDIIWGQSNQMGSGKFKKNNLLSELGRHNKSDFQMSDKKSQRYFLDRPKGYIQQNSQRKYLKNHAIRDSQEDFEKDYRIKIKKYKKILLPSLKTFDRDIIEQQPQNPDPRNHPNRNEYNSLQKDAKQNLNEKPFSKQSRVNIDVISNDQNESLNLRSNVSGNKDIKNIQTQTQSMCLKVESKRNKNDSLQLKPSKIQKRKEKAQKQSKANYINKDNIQKLKFFKWSQKSQQPQYNSRQSEVKNNLPNNVRQSQSSVNKIRQNINQSNSSTIFHKYKLRLSNKKPIKQTQKESISYSVLSNGLFQIPEEDQIEGYLQYYRPINPSFSIKQLLKSPKFKVVQGKGKLYFGQMKENKRNGKGINLSQKQLYQGEYQNDKKSFGCQKNRDGIYEGEFFNGKRDGKGKFIWTNGQTYQGQWSNGKKNGIGIWKSLKGDYYEGQWRQNRQNGKGTHFHHSGSIYKGSFKQFLKEGQGQQQFANGDKYIGQYSKGKPNGYGKYYWKNGDRYEGSFIDGSREGKGLLSLKSGQVYKGQFKNDLKDGQGTEYLASGQQFKGFFKDGQRMKGVIKYFSQK